MAKINGRECCYFKKQSCYSEHCIEITQKFEKFMDTDGCGYECMSPKQREKYNKWFKEETKKRRSAYFENTTEGRIRRFAIENSDKLGVLSGVGRDNKDILERHFNSKDVFNQQNFKIFNSFYKAHHRITERVNQVKRTIKTNAPPKR